MQLVPAVAPELEPVERPPGRTWVLKRGAAGCLVELVDASIRGVPAETLLAR